LDHFTFFAFDVSLYRACKQTRQATMINGNILTMQKRKPD